MYAIDEPVNCPETKTGSGGFNAPGNTGGSGIGPERALEAITPSPRAQRESDPLFELPCERRPGPAEPDTKAHHRTS
jgi:hypothetical protein